MCGTGAGQTDDCMYKSINGKTTKRKQQNKQRKTLQLMGVDRGRGGHTKVAARIRLGYHQSGRKQGETGE